MIRVTTHEVLPGGAGGGGGFSAGGSEKLLMSGAVFVALQYHLML